MPKHESYKSIAARVRLASQYLEQGKADDARAILDDLASILPPPDKRHWDAATQSYEQKKTHLKRPGRASVGNQFNCKEYST